MTEGRRAYIAGAPREHPLAGGHHSQIHIGTRTVPKFSYVSDYSTHFHEFRTFGQDDAAGFFFFFFLLRTHQQGFIAVLRPCDQVWNQRRQAFRSRQFYRILSLRLSVFGVDMVAAGSMGDVAALGIAAAGAGLTVGLLKAAPWISQGAYSAAVFGWERWQWLSVGSFAVNVAAVSVPGRIDGEIAQDAKLKKI